MRDWLLLTRASGLFTLAGNLLAAVSLAVYSRELSLVVLGEQLYPHRSAIPWVILSSSLLYLSLMLWNDIADQERDRVLHPRRALPSGRVHPLTAWVVGLLLSSAALLAAAPLGLRGLCGAGVVLSLGLIYDFSAKAVPWLGSLVMAATRMSHAVFVLLILGPDCFDRAVAAITGHGGSAEASLPVYPLYLGAYIFGLTLISELESRPGRRWELLVGGMAMAGAILAVLWRLVTAHWLGLGRIGGQGLMYLACGCFVILALWLAWRVLRPWFSAVRSAERLRIGPVVGAGLGAMVLFDAVLAASAHPLMGILVAALALPFALARAVVRMD